MTLTVAGSEVYLPPISFQLVKRDRVAKFLEEALGDLLRLARQAPNLAQDGLLLHRQVLGDDDLHDDVLVAATAAADVRHTPARQPKGLAVLSAGRDGDLDQPLERRDLDPVAERRLDNVHAELIHRVL